MSLSNYSKAEQNNPRQKRDNRREKPQNKVRNFVPEFFFL